MMKLHSAPASPFARKCWVCAHELGLMDQIEAVARMGTPLMTDNMPVAQNPLGKIPALEREDGPAVYDSRVITQYLNKRADGALYPPARVIETLTLEATADGIMDAAILMVYEARCRDEAIRYTDWVEAQWGKVSRGLDALGDLWMSHLSGPLDAGQIAVGCALGYLDFRLGDRNWREGRDALAAWEAEFAKRDSMVATAPKDA